MHAQTLLHEDSHHSLLLLAMPCKTPSWYCLSLNCHLSFVKHAQISGSFWEITSGFISKTGLNMMLDQVVTVKRKLHPELDEFFLVQDNDGCNWFWEKRYSENRLPQVFVQARITKEGQSPNTPCYSSGRRCRLIFFNQIIPRRECDENATKFKWALNFEKIAVGASCQKL